MAACSQVPAGHVGIKVYLLGQKKGVDIEVLPVGRYWIGINEQLYTFPTFEQNYVWTRDEHEGNTHDESITFQDNQGTTINGDFGISYHIEPEKAATVFQKYRRGLDEITDIFLRNQVRDALNKVASKMTVDEIYGEKKGEFMEEAQGLVADQVKDIGIYITKIYIVGSLRLPENVTTALNLKIASTQRAIQRENELREAEAQAKKDVAQAEGQAKALLATAGAQAEANLTLAKSLTPELVQYKAIEKWNGSLPQVNGASTPFVNIGK